jgi:hypothetical protein
MRQSNKVLIILARVSSSRGKCRKARAAWNSQKQHRQQKTASHNGVDECKPSDADLSISRCQSLLLENLIKS